MIFALATWALKVAIGLMLAGLFLYLSSIAIAWYRLQFYVKQGITVIFDPFKGFMTFSDPTRKENQGDPLGFTKKLVNENRTKAAFASNSAKGSDPILYIHNPEYYKEFVAKEIQNTHKVTMVRGGTDHFGFFFQNGAKAEKLRRIFGEIFTIENLGKFASQMYNILDRDIQEFKKENGMASDKSKTI